ncbi:transcription termination factor MTEF18, mitochondrial [Neltuma alba]|uniref:transcription termination factor MTEF18, mitochondrial n=1 Tax=Neltuma alba TaxID=207710 RepID=UPI0010A3FF74|nr:transcription termination factor MTEF18, mitochondrial-like [Prosopis alba]
MGKAGKTGQPAGCGLARGGLRVVCGAGSKGPFSDDFLLVLAWLWPDDPPRNSISILDNEETKACSSMFLNSFAKIFLRHISTTSSTTRKLLKSSKIPQRYQKFAVREAQKVLTDYLHETRCLPFVLADQIAKNSLLSLVNLIVKVDFSASTFSRNFEKYLRYNPIDEFEFFFESIGIDYNNGVSELLPPNKVFFSEDGSLLEAARALSFFGFPWDKLGNLYKECSSVFRRSSKELGSKLYEFKKRGFGNVEVVGICLAFPNILGKEGEEVDGEIDGLFTDLKSVFFDFELARYVEGNIDSWHEMPVVSVSKLLKHFGLSPKILEDVSKKYDHVLGTNKMDNLPNVMRALDLHGWFFNKMKDGNHNLLISYLATHPNEEKDKEYQAGLTMICASSSRNHMLSKLNFLHGLGFGENAVTIDIAAYLHGYSWKLQKRFEFLLHLGFEFSKLCIMVKKAPKILNQKSQVMDEKVKFFCQEMGIPLQCLTPLAALLYYNLENRIKPRYGFHMWLKEKGLFGEKYTITTVISRSNNQFVDIAYKIHPAAPKHWFEQFYVLHMLWQLVFVFPLSGLCSINGVPSTPCPEGSWRNVNCCLCKAAARVQTCDRVVKKELGISYLARLRFRLKDPKC